MTNVTLAIRKCPYSPFFWSLLLAWAAFPAMGSEGVFLLGNDAQQLGRASSGVASPRSAYWSYMNPASIVELDRRFDINWYSVFTDVELHPRGLIGNRFDGTLESEVIGNIVSTGFIWPLSTGTLGGGVFIPSGSGVDFPHSRTWFSQLLGQNCDRRLSYQHIRGVLSYGLELGNGWSVGAGLHGSLSRFRTDHLTLSFRPAEMAHEWDHALGAGFGVGLYKRWDKWSWGVNYSSRHWTDAMHEYGDLLRSALDTPRTVQTGVAWKATDRLELTLDYKWLNWEGIPTYGGDLMGKGGFMWRDQHSGKFGVEWKASAKWILMAGYSYANSPIHEDHVLLSALVPVNVEHHWTAGVTHKINEKNEIHLVGVWAPHHTMKDTGRGDEPFSLLGKGSTVSSGAFSVALGYSYLF
ncbi:MAG TPA: outer membrane protein transport protein [Candidatus Hydrogenedentes bacterium]|nr:outer membrane protein transport protein [Candidatus Hydrogenedentota bacterium]